MIQLWKGLRTALLLMVILVGCAPRFHSPETSGTARSEFLMIRTATTMVTLPLDGSGMTKMDFPVVSAPDFSRLFTSVRHSGTTEVIAFETEGSTRQSVTMVRGDFEPSVVAQDGRTIALLASNVVGDGPWIAQPRERTDLVIVGQTGSQTRFTLPGNFQPEAFSADAKRLFMIEYLPAIAPDRYRVRQLDLALGIVSPVGGRLKQPAPEEMKGIGRTQDLSYDGTTLYTLYTRQVESYPHGKPEHSDPDANFPIHSFIHILNLEAGWAHCVDLPEPFGMSSPEDNALTVSRDGSKIYVADGSEGLIATVNTRSLNVVRTGEFDKPTKENKVGLQIGEDGTLFVTSGDKVLLIDAHTLNRRGEFALPVAASSAMLSPDGQWLFVGGADAVLKLDSSNGRVIERFDVPGIQSIEGIGA